MTGGFQFPFGTALLRNVIENAAVPTFLTYANGDVFYANRAFGALLGYAPEEIVELGIGRIVHPEDAAKARAQTGALGTGETRSYRAERRYIDKNGEVIWVLASGAPLIDETTGSFQFITVQAVDITGQKRAEQALAEGEKRWNSALEAAGQGVWDHDLRRGTVFFSPVWRQMRGLGPRRDLRHVPRGLVRAHAPG